MCHQSTDGTLYGANGGNADTRCRSARALHYTREELLFRGRMAPELKAVKGGEGDTSGSAGLGDGSGDVTAITKEIPRGTRLPPERDSRK